MCLNIFLLIRVAKKKKWGSVDVAECGYNLNSGAILI